MSPDPIEAGLAWLAGRDAVESAIAAHELGGGGDLEGARRWVRWLLDRERGGSWNDSVGETATALLTIRELRSAAGLRELDPAIGRGLDWIGSRRNAPGAWTDGCDPERHARRLCHHFAAGFYAPAGDALEGLTLPSGARAADTYEARFMVSALALRCMLEWRGLTTDRGIHLDVLAHVARGWEQSAPPGLGTTALLAAVHGLVGSPRERDHQAAADALAWVARHQRGDGSWPDADPFHAMAVFTAAHARGVGGERVHKTLGHGARLLSAAQREDGSWGPDENGPRRALIALRTLRAAGY